MVSHAIILTTLDEVIEGLDRGDYLAVRRCLDTARALVKEQEADILQAIASINSRLSEQIQISREALKCRSS